MYDIGRLAVIATAGIETAVENRGRPKSERKSSVDLRRDAAVRPTALHEVDISIIIRLLASMYLIFGCSVLMLVAAIVAGLSPENIRIVPVLVLNASIVVGVLAFATLNICFVRLALSRLIGYRGFDQGTHKLGKGRFGREQLRQRAAVQRQGGPSRLIRWLITPSFLDNVPVLGFAAVFLPRMMAGC